MTKTPCLIEREYDSEDGSFMPSIQEKAFFLTWGTMSSSILTEDNRHTLISSDTCAVIMRVDGHVERISPERVIFIVEDERQL